jgi:hypothetical protein
MDGSYNENFILENSAVAKTRFTRSHSFNFFLSGGYIMNQLNFGASKKAYAAGITTLINSETDI